MLLRKDGSMSAVALGVCHGSLRIVAGGTVDTAWSCWAGSRSLVPAQHHHLRVCDGLGLSVSGNG